MTSDDDALRPAERELWYAFLAWTKATLANVAADLTSAAGLSMPDVEVLIRLAEAPPGGIGQRELIRSLDWSASRASHHLSRMSDRGLIARHSSGSGRLVTVRLTARGRAEFDRAQPHLAAAVRRHFLDHLSENQRGELLRSRPAGVGPDGQVSDFARYVLADSDDVEPG